VNARDGDAPFDLAAARYVSLVTRRRDGREVATPVWIASSEGAHYVFSEARAGKVRRIRANPAVRLALCDMRGRVLSGACDATARIVTDPSIVARAYVALRRKYGWQMWLIDLLSRLAGRYDRRAILEIRC